MDIGLDTQEDLDQLTRVLEAIDEAAALCDRLPDDPATLDQPGSDLNRMIALLPEPQVDPRLTVYQGLGISRGALGLVRSIFLDNSPAIVPSVLPVLLRSALLGAGRILFMLGPVDEAQRIANTVVVLKQEAASFHTAYTQFAGFQHFQALIPASETVALYERRRVALMRGGRPPGEARTLDSMAEVIGELLAGTESAVPSQTDDDLSGLAREHLRWMFNVYSGVAHGFAWPWLGPHTRSLPGHFIAEFTTATNVAYLAADVTLRRAGISQ